jgi:hypothetical protein
MSLPPYQKDSPCPKCGECGASTRYCDGRTDTGYILYGENVYVDAACRPLGEHFHRTCRNCDYPWEEAVAPSPPVRRWSDTTECALFTSPHWENGATYTVLPACRPPIVHIDPYGESPRYYECMQTHVANRSSRPLTGADWSTYWREVLWQPWRESGR